MTLKGISRTLRSAYLNDQMTIGHFFFEKCPLESFLKLFFKEPEIAVIII